MLPWVHTGTNCCTCCCCCTKSHRTSQPGTNCSRTDKRNQDLNYSETGVFVTPRGHDTHWLTGDWRTHTFQSRHNPRYYCAPISRHSTGPLGPLVQHSTRRTHASMPRGSLRLPKAEGSSLWQFALPVRGCTKSTIFATKPFLASPPAPSFFVLCFFRDPRPNASCCTRNTCWEAMVEGPSPEARYDVDFKFENHEVYCKDY